MSSQQPHRKKVKHYHEPGDFHELTFSCYHRMKLLTNDTWRGHLARSIDAASARGVGRVLAGIKPTARKLIRRCIGCISCYRNYERCIVEETNGFGISIKLLRRSFAYSSPTAGGRALAKASGTRARLTVWPRFLGG